jgi:hypothetical protein
MDFLDPFGFLVFRIYTYQGNFDVSCKTSCTIFEIELATPSLCITMMHYLDYSIESSKENT